MRAVDWGALSALAAVVLAGLGYLSRQLTRSVDRLDGRLDRVDGRIDRLEAVLSARIDRLDGRFDRLEEQYIRHLEAHAAH